jgi:sugar transferase (PEP-CTERM/EpsH1 system associated)
MTAASLLLCHRLPYPPNKGDKIRSFALLRHLASKGPVHVACFIDDPEDLKFQAEVERIAGGTCYFEPIGRAAKWLRAVNALVLGEPITTSYFASPNLSRWIDGILATEVLENIVVFSSAMAPYLLHSKTEARRALFDMVDVDSDKWLQYSSSALAPLGWIYARESRAVARLEAAAARAFGRTLLVSPFECDTLKSMVPDCAQRIAPVNNGVDLDYFTPNVQAHQFLAGECAVVMTGRMDYRPNFEGAIWFSQQVAPRVRAMLPNAHFYFVGSSPPSVMRRISNEWTTVTGAVDDVRPYIAGAEAVIAPLQMARGVQNKVLEAMAMARPVVATHEATRALNVSRGVHLWVENDPKRFANAVVAAIQSPSRYAIMQNARKFVEAHHDWNKIFEDFDRELSWVREARVNDKGAVDHSIACEYNIYRPSEKRANT